jgi:glycosyltransferase involved in cell wall biosynthesis
MRILYLQTFPFYGSGSGTYARFLAAQVGKRHKVAILAPDKRSPKRTKLYELKMPFKVAFTGHPEWPNCRLYEDLTPPEITRIYEVFLRSTHKTVDDFKPDIIHVHHAYPFSWAARAIYSLYKINYVVTVHGSELPTAGKAKVYKSLTIEAMRRAKKIIPNSYWTRDWFLDVYGEELRKKNRVIAPGVSLNRFNPDLPVGPIERRYGIAPEDNIVLFAGKLTEYKGVKYIIRAAKKIDAKVYILGQGPEEKALKKYAKDIKASNVYFVDHLADTEELNRFYNRADVFVAPSVWDEPLGLVILEAMACRTPVVVTRKGGIPLAVKDNYNGVFIRPRNSTHIVEEVNMLLKDDEKRRKMGERARAIVEKRFSWHDIAHKFELLYQRSRTNGSGWFNRKG